MPSRCRWAGGPASAKGRSMGLRVLCSAHLPDSHVMGRLLRRASRGPWPGAWILHLSRACVCGMWCVSVCICVHGVCVSVCMSVRVCECACVCGVWVV